MKYRINAKLFNATVSAQATNDVRYYLNGFFLSAERSELVATNGHIMCIAPIDKMEGDETDETSTKHGASGEGWIFSGITEPLPQSAQEVVIDTEVPRLEVIGLKYKGPRYVVLEPIDARYPAYKTVKAERDVKAKVQAERAFNTEYLYRAFRWAGIKNGESVARFIFPESANDSAEVHPSGRACAEINQLHITLMPCRVG